MNPALTLPAPASAERLTQIIEALRRVVAAHGNRHWVTNPVLVLLYNYLNRVARRFELLARRLENGRVAAFRPRAGAAPRGSEPGKSEPGKSEPGDPEPGELKPPNKRLPRGFGWLARLGPDVRTCGSQLSHLLRSPEMAALLAASPQAARILRPLCRMLAIEPAPDLPPSLFAPPAPRDCEPQPGGAAMPGDPETGHAAQDGRLADAPCNDERDDPPPDWSKTE